MTAAEIIESHNRIHPYIHKTPVLTSKSIDNMVGAALYFKCENFQKMGAFKMRGATNVLMQLTEAQREKGVVTHSSGNFAQAVALAARNIGIKAYIVMPENAPQVKKDAVRGYGGEIHESKSTQAAREKAANKIVEQNGATFVHPYNDTDVILGQATAGMELLREYPKLEYIVTPVGGGGLIAGTSLSAKFFSQKCRVIGAEPFEVDDAYRSLKSGNLETNKTTNTIADGLRTNLGDKTFPIIREHVDRIIRVEESEIVAAMRIIWERMKLVVEPSSAVALAALLREQEKFRNVPIGIIISGGNVDLAKLPFGENDEETKTPLRHRFGL